MGEIERVGETIRDVARAMQAAAEALREVEDCTQKLLADEACAQTRGGDVLAESALSAPHPPMPGYPPMPPYPPFPPYVVVTGGGASGQCGCGGPAHPGCGCGVHGAATAMPASGAGVSGPSPTPIQAGGATPSTVITPPPPAVPVGSPQGTGLAFGVPVTSGGQSEIDVPSAALRGTGPSAVPRSNVVADALLDLGQFAADSVIHPRPSETQAEGASG
jgi:hypothetical protein